MTLQLPVTSMMGRCPVAVVCMTLCSAPVLLIEYLGWLEVATAQ